MLGSVKRKAAFLKVFIALRAIIVSAALTLESAGKKIVNHQSDFSTL